MTLQQILGQLVQAGGHVDDLLADVPLVADELAGGLQIRFLGGDGAVMACDEGVFRGLAPKIDVVNPVGAGDTMVGAFACAMSRGLGCADQLAYAMSCASANCMSASTGHFDMAVARELLAGTTVERVA